MRAYVLPQGCSSSDELRLVERPEPSPKPGQVLVRLRAASLNFRDQAIATGNYMGGKVPRDLIPLSDGAGEVVEVGEGVQTFKPGDRVMGVFSQVPPDGSPGAQPLPLGSPLDGVLAEYAVFWESGLVPMPAGYSFEEGATLPCAGVTAWNALFEAGRPVAPGDTVLVQGTGGVSMFALAFAKAAGCRVVATSSSDAKLQRVRALGADETINYKQTPDWDKAAVELTGGKGVDCVVEIGGLGTLQRSMQAIARGGKVGLIGVLTNAEASGVNPHVLMLKGGSLHGIFVGNKAMFERMVRAIEANGVKPLVDRVFPFEQAADAYRHQQGGDFMGKVVIRID